MAETLWARIARMTRGVPRPPEPPTLAEVQARVNRMLDRGPIMRPATVHMEAGGWTLDTDRMTRRQQAGLPLGKKIDETADGYDRSRLPRMLEDLVSGWDAPAPVRRRPVTRTRKIKRPTWCRTCGRLTSTCLTIGECP